MVVLPPKHGEFGGKTTVIWRQISAVRRDGASLRGWPGAEITGRKGVCAPVKPPGLVQSRYLIQAADVNLERSLPVGGREEGKMGKCAAISDRWELGKLRLGRDKILPVDLVRRIVIH